MNLLKRLLGKGCFHHFSWPRLYTDGHHYQTCSLCGKSYEYDWALMRRTNRLKVSPAQLQWVVAPESTRPAKGL